jgi:hypothetical protein
MAHLCSIHIRIGHALQKKERWAVGAGRHSPRGDIARAKGLCRFIGDQIEMTHNNREISPPQDVRNSVMALFWPVWGLYWELYRELY